MTKSEVIRRIEHLEEVYVSPESTARLLQKIRQVMVDASKDHRNRVPVVTLPRVAALISCAAATIGTILVSFWFIGGTSVAFADVLERVLKTQMVRLVQTTKVEGQPDRTEHVILLADGRCRIQMDESAYTIMDTRQAKIMAVNHKDKKVMILHGRPGHGPENLYDYFRNMHKDSAKKLPARQINGKSASGFLVSVQHEPFPPEEIEIWVDLDSDLPVEMMSNSTDEQGNEVALLIHDIQFDEGLDETLFSFEVPQGYTVEEHGQARLAPLPEEKELFAPEVKPGVGLGPLRFGIMKDEVIALLGMPDAIEGNGTILAYFSRGYTVYTSPQRGFFSYLCYSQAAFAIQVRDFAGQTSSGIGIGSSLDDLKAVFGAPDQNTDKDSIGRRLTYYAQGLDFDLHNDKVVQFMVQRVRQSAPE